MDIFLDHWRLDKSNIRDFKNKLIQSEITRLNMPDLTIESGPDFDVFEEFIASIDHCPDLTVVELPHFSLKIPAYSDKLNKEIDHFIAILARHPHIKDVQLYSDDPQLQTAIDKAVDHAKNHLVETVIRPMYPTIVEMTPSTELIQEVFEKHEKLMMFSHIHEASDLKPKRSK